MTAPNVLDRIVGHIVIVATAWTALALTGYFWFTDGTASGPAVIFSVIAALWTATSRQKIANERQWQRREAAALGYAPEARRSWFGQLLILAISLPLAVIAYIFLSQLARGYGLAIEEDIAAWFRVAKRYGTAIDVRMLWPIGAAGAGLLFLAAMRRVRGVRRTRKARRALRGWTGVVEVMLPVPDDG